MFSFTLKEKNHTINDTLNSCSIDINDNKIIMKYKLDIDEKIIIMQML